MLRPSCVKTSLKIRPVNFPFVISTILALSATTRATAQQNAELCPEKPKLVLMIVVDNLNSRQVDIVRNQCDSKGLNRLFGYGTQLTDAYYDAGGNFAGKNLATLFTGAPAATHGIVARQWIDSFSGHKVDAIYGDVPTSGAFDTLAAPHNGALLCNTIANEIRKIYNNQAKIFSVGFDPQMLIWSSGTLAGEPFLWLDPRTGKVRTANVNSSETLKWVDDFNSKGMASLYSAKTWAPRKNINEYHQCRFFPETTAKLNFYHPLNKPKLGMPRFKSVMGSPYGNDMVRDLAAYALTFENMGKDNVTDIMLVQFTATPACGRKQQPLDPETEDLLLGLDANIASLLQLIDGTIGMDNTLVIFTSAQGAYDVANTDSPQWAERGFVSMRRATALLNLYLMALHGQERWVKNYAPGAVYLDKDIAEKRKVDFDSLLSQSAGFLTQVKGIGDAIPASKLTTLVSTSPVIEAMRRNYHPKRSGDILIHLEPGWAEEQDDGSRLTQLWGGEFVPLVFYGWKVKRGMIYERHNMTDVAPTICSFIKVGIPDGCSGKPIDLGIQH